MGIPRKILRWRRRPHDEKSETDGSFLLQWGPPPLVADPDILVRVFPNDVIFNEEEYSFMRGICSKTASFRLIAIEADFATRSQRLIRRQDRPCTARQLETRDAFELNQLGIRKVIDLANFKVINESGLDEFEFQLRALWSASCANNT
jgi:hypothetical protein